jgi:hypothetical protein
VRVEDEPRLEWEDLSRILLLLMRIDAKLDEFLGRTTMPTRKNPSPEDRRKIRAELRELQREVRAAIALLQAKLDQRPAR